MAIENAQLTTTQLDILIVPAGKSYAITTIIVCNTNLSASTDSNFNLYIAKDADAIGPKNTIVRGLELPAGETFTFDSEKIVLEEGDYVAFEAQPESGDPNLDSGETDLAATISYLEV